MSVCVCVCIWFKHKVLSRGAYTVAQEIQSYVFYDPSGAPLSIHPGRDTTAPFEILDILKEAGADISRTSMCHLDRTYFDTASLLKFAEQGSYLSFDQFGNECSHYQVILYLIHYSYDSINILCNIT